jgi:lipid A 4'-phosphatase
MAQQAGRATGVAFLALAGLCLATAVFCLWPGIDLWASAVFFDGSGFPVQTLAPVEAARQVFYAAEDIAGFAAFPLALWTMRRGPVLGQGPRVWAYQGLVFLAGPLVAVNLVIKPLWSRPRPFRVTDFGGPDLFQPIWQLHGTCPRNCSFTSGEMAGAAALSLMGVMLARANRATLAGAYPVAVAAALLPLPFTAWQRLAAGRHFLSDEVFSLLVVGLIAAVLSRMLRGTDA